MVLHQYKALYPCSFFFYIFSSSSGDIVKKKPTGFVLVLIVELFKSYLNNNKLQKGLINAMQDLWQQSRIRRKNTEFAPCLAQPLKWYWLISKLHIFLLIIEIL